IPFAGQKIVIEAAGRIHLRVGDIPHDLVVSPAHQKRVVVDAGVGAAEAQRFELIVFVFEDQSGDGVVAAGDSEDVARAGDGDLAGRLCADVDGGRGRAVDGLRADVQAGPDAVFQDDVV